MDVDDSYPNVLYDGLPPDGVRLLTAVHIACVDAGGGVFGLKFNEDELQDFFDTSTHRYFSVKPRGNLKKAVNLLTRAVCTSVQNKELKLNVVRKSLENELSLLNSWVSFADFEEWCESRSIRLGDSWFEFLKDESLIAESAAEAMDERRRRLEGFFADQDIDDLKENFETHGIDYLIEEAASLRAKVKKLEKKTLANEEKPLATRERNTLLTIIAALCKEAKLDHTKHAKTAGLIEDTAKKMGLSVGETTIEGHLKKITSTVVTRMQ
ncbi:MAG: hypothetical protein NDI95_05635 [Acidovorax soli]|uniref:hypothetical protein n=1 Tax=Acidovorax soli TaxID=592050 RepID=UPI0026EE7D72|nr:hypothetical protein [Acidovorax soli]MCM2346114.1 hypothetical protein [Acidovorax soli]